MSSRGRERDFDEVGKKIKRDSYDSSHMGVRRQLLNTITPCAACKLLRRRCSEECPFSPYFSPHEPHKFAAVHKVFGASNVSKMLMEVPENQRADAANSLVYEANVRLSDPVYGCMGAIIALQQQVQSLQAEVNAVRAEILNYKYKEAASTATTSNVVPTAIVPSSIMVTSPSPPQPSRRPPPPPPPPAAGLVSSLTTSSSSTPSPYTIAHSTTTGYGTANNIPYFD